MITIEGTGTFIGCTEQDMINVTKGEKGFISPFVRPSETAAGPTMACALNTEGFSSVIKFCPTFLDLFLSRVTLCSNGDKAVAQWQLHVQMNIHRVFVPSIGQCPQLLTRSADLFIFFCFTSLSLLDPACPSIFPGVFSFHDF